MMVPLTESLYVSGQVHDKEKVLVELGAGYYAEVRQPAQINGTNAHKTKQNRHHSEHRVHAQQLTVAQFQLRLSRTDCKRSVCEGMSAAVDHD
jgi:prefoldin subunit 5